MSRFLRLAITLAGFAAIAPSAIAQVNNNGNTGGIHIDADGVITMALRQDRGGKLDKQRRAALEKQALPGDVSRPSSQRMVSLVRLEAACAERLQNGQALTQDIACLAGLTRIDSVFVDPAEKDLIIAGPAEPFAQGESGRWIGLETGWPVLLLDDFLIALRSVTPGCVVGCSIDPVPERAAKLQQFIQANSTPAVPAVIERRYRAMTEILGNYDVRIMGVPDDSHFARALVEADYRMKLLTLGIEKPGVKGFRSHLSLVSKTHANQRWWFSPLYDSLLRSEDGLAFEFAGQRAQLLGEDELTDAAGQRSPAAANKVSTLDYSRQFTEKFPQLAENMPVFAALQQLIDWTVLVALMQRDQLEERIDWTMPLFADGEQLPHESLPVPKQVPCLLNTRVGSGGAIIGEFAGGVTIHPDEVLRKIATRTDGSVEFVARRAKALLRTKIPDHPWWWD